MPAVSALIMKRRLCLLLALPGLAAAQDDPGAFLGAGVRSLPEYDGSSQQEVDVIPIVRWYGETFFARTSQGILEGGARKELLPGLVAGAQIAYEAGNERTDLDWGASYGLHLEWDTKVGRAPVTLLARTRYHFDTDQGAQTDLRATVGVYGSHGFLAGVFGQATWATSEWVRSYYGAGDGGLLHTNLGIEGGYTISRQWLAVASLSSRWLHGDAATSPITERKRNTYASAGLAYRF
jgi:outer membrane scaffolding protein for murein synthesis (MipA/OmpV family)